MSFLHPQLLVLLLLLPLVWRFLTNRRLTVSSVLRLLVAATAIVALSRPRLGFSDSGTDLIVMVDRSASCGAEAGRMFRELWPIIKRGEGEKDRTAVISFGNGARVERGFAADESGVNSEANSEYASDISAAIELAHNMRSPDRRTAVLCLTDGRFTGRDPEDPDIISRLDAMPFWYRRLGGGTGFDAAAGRMSVPEAVAPRSAWLVRYVIEANAPGEATYSLSRNGLRLAGGTVMLRRGVNHFFARDTATEEGFLEYRLEVNAPGDSVAENNVAIALLRVEGPPKVLIVTDSGSSGLLERALTAAAIPVDVIATDRFPDSPALLSPYKLVVLENCQLTAIPGMGVEMLAEAVESGLTSLLVTGGSNSFGVGGYHRSAIDPLLPVEMELRNEKRRGTMAVAIAMDRSGSMAMDAGGGKTKMDLANLGAAESIRLLAPNDEVSVIAVDTAPHVVIPLSRVDDTEQLVGLVLRIKSMGGGIYCYTAVKAAAAELEKSGHPNRHIVLFADASDAEEQDHCLELARTLSQDGIMLSVIAMGTRSDSDARFLQQLAWAGGGEALFSSHAGGIPALFTQEIIRVSRRGFIEERVAPVPLPAISSLGVEQGAGLPELDGYNVSAARDGAVVMARMDDEYSTPLIATRIDGKTVSAALMFEVDGRFSGQFPAWDKAPELLVSLARRLAGGVNRVGVKGYSGMSGGLAELELEFSPATAEQARGSGMSAKWLGPDGETLESDFEWLSPSRTRTGATPLRPGHYLPVVDIPGLGVAAAPPVSLSYSGEFDLRQMGTGLATLRALAAGGGEGLDIADVRRSAREERPGGIELRPYLLAAALFLFLLELSGRRLLWFT